MVSASKLIPPGMTALSCSEVLHPWTKSCSKAAFDLYVQSCIGSSGYFALLFFCQYVVRAMKKKNQILVTDVLKSYVNTCLFSSSALACSFIIISCFLRHVLGRFYSISLVFIPATLSGFVISQENQRNKEFFSTAFATLAFEYMINDLKIVRGFKWSPTTETFIFMTLTALVSYLFSMSQNAKKYLWFYIPEKIIASEGKLKTCFHGDHCLKNILGTSMKYFSTGVLLKFLKLLIFHYKTPFMIFWSFFQPKTYSFAAFLGCYALFYESTRCLSYKKWRKYLPLQDLIAGFLSGAAYRFDPNTSALTSAMVTIFQLLLEIGSRKNVLPNLPYDVFIFALSCGMLFHARLFSPTICPRLMHYILSSITNKKADAMADNYHKLMLRLGNNSLKI